MLSFIIQAIFLDIYDIYRSVQEDEVNAIQELPVPLFMNATQSEDQLSWSLHSRLQ